MILKELCDFYDRLETEAKENPRIDIPAFGWSVEKVDWELVIDDDGHVLEFVPLVLKDAAPKMTYQLLQVPEHGGRSGNNPAPYFLCDNAKYFFGLDKECGERRHSNSRLFHEKVLAGCDHPAARAVLRFFESSYGATFCSDEQREKLADGKLFIFRYAPQMTRVHEIPEIRACWEAYRSRPKKGERIGQCLVYGETTSLARLFPQVTGLPGAQTAGASLVSFNFDACESYGKKKTDNASISEKAAFKAGAALKYVLGNRERRISLGDTLVTFWADRDATKEDMLLMSLLGGAVNSEDRETLDAIHNAFVCMKQGLPIMDDFDLRAHYCILGISPTAARLSVRFFERDTLGTLLVHFSQYLQDISMVDVKDAPFRSLLLQTAPQGKNENIPSTLISSFFFAMIHGKEFPLALQELLLSRMRADHASSNRWDLGQRAALFKGCLVRRSRRRLGNDHKEMIDMALSRDNTNIGYLLGRMFAVMESAQQMAVGTDTNATIRDRYMTAASTTPRRVFPSLMAGCETHLGTLRKKKPGLYWKLGNELDEIIGLMPGDGLLPKTLDVDDQMRFFIAFHQERVDLLSSKGKGVSAESGSLDEIDKE